MAFLHLAGLGPFTQTPAFAGGGVRVTQLASGLRIATDPMPGLASVAVGAWLGAGSRHEAAEDHGVAHLFEHMVFKGTPTRSARQIAETIEAVGGQLNAYTGREASAYYARALAPDLPLALTLIADMLLRAAFDPAELARERDVVIQEIGQVADTPDDLIFDLAGEAGWAGQSLGRPILGTPQSVAALEPAALRRFRARHVQPGNLVIAAAGAVEHDALVAEVARLFADWPAAEPLAAGPPPARWTGGAVRPAEPEDEAEQAHLVLGWPSVGLTHADHAATAVAAMLLGGGMSSRLFQTIREERGLAYSVFSTHAPQAEDGALWHYVGTAPEQAEEAATLMLAALGDLAARPPAEDEVQRAQAQMVAGLLMGIESPMGRAEALGHALLAFGRPLSPAEQVRRIEAVTPADIMRVTAEALAAAPVVASVGPVPEAIHDPAWLRARL